MTRGFWRSGIAVLMIAAALLATPLWPALGSQPASALGVVAPGAQSPVIGHDKKDQDKKKPKDDPADHDQGRGNDDKTKQPPGQVKKLPKYLVRVVCASDDSGASACMFLALDADHPTTPVTRIAVPGDAVCGTVTGGSFSADLSETAFADFAPASKDAPPAYVGDGGALLLLIDAQVTLADEGTYWVEADGVNVYPATGPGLACAESHGTVMTAPAPTPTPAPTGRIVVRAFLCDPGISAASDINWYAACDTAAAGAAFAVSPAPQGTGTVPLTGRADDQGRLTFPSLDPGTYHLERTDGAWCHAESDSVTETGDVTVDAGQASTIWVFNCQS